MNRLTRRIHSLRLHTKLLLSYVFIILIPLVTWSVVSYSQTNARLRANAESDLDSMVRFTKQTIQNRLFLAEQTLNLFAEDYSIAAIVNANYVSEYQKAQDLLGRFDPLLASIFEQNMDFENLTVYTYGSLKNVRRYFIDAGGVEGAETARLLCGREPLWIYHGGVLTVSRKAINIDAPNASATLCFEVNEESLFSGALPSQTQNYRLTVTDGLGALLYSSGDEAAASSEQLLVREEVLPDTGWRLQIEADIRPVTISVLSAFQSTALVILLSFAILLVVVLLFSRTFSARITRLKMQLDEVVPSEYKVDIRSEERDEIGDITNAVGRMIRDTRRMILTSYQARLDRRDAQLSALQAQINPHFLYNTLSNLNWRTIQSGDEEMSGLLTALSSFYRLSLNSGRSVSTVGQEISHVKTYLEIEAAVHRLPALSVTYDVEEDLLDYSIPSVILQPLVENALEHGLGPIGLENGRLTISVRRVEETYLEIRIEDNGPGMEPTVAEAVFSDAGDAPGYGLRNVWRRLRLFFEDQCSIRMEETPGGGTTVVIRIPQYVQPDGRRE